MPNSHSIALIAHILSNLSGWQWMSVFDKVNAVKGNF